MTENSLNDFPVQLTDEAIKKAKSLLPQEGFSLHIAVTSGGCSGLIYKLFYAEPTLMNGDVIEDFDGLDVVVDSLSVPYLTGATLDYHDTIEKQGFSLDNPLAQSSCGCGESFS